MDLSEVLAYSQEREKLRGNSRSQLIADGKRNNNCRIPPKEFLTVFKTPSTVVSYMKQQSKLAVVRTHSLISALNITVLLLHCMYKISTIHAIRNL